MEAPDQLMRPWTGVTGNPTSNATTIKKSVVLKQARWLAETWLGLDVKDNGGFSIPLSFGWIAKMLVPVVSMFLKLNL